MQQLSICTVITIVISIYCAPTRAVTGGRECCRCDCSIGENTEASLVSCLLSHAVITGNGDDTQEMDRGCLVLILLPPNQ